MHMQVINDLKKIGILLDGASGHVFYDASYQVPILDSEMVLVRHGETYGNCGQATTSGEIDVALVNAGKKDKNKRVFQGNVDSEINQLTEVGKEQANALAQTLEEKLLRWNWIPDLIFHSPLTRAKDTGLPFIHRNGLADRYVVFNEIREMSFGLWENQRVCDIAPDHPCHLFYEHQHALVKESGIDKKGIFRHAECFAEVLMRAHHVIEIIRAAHGKKRILLFTHSMIGAALAILFGHGQTVAPSHHLAFDGHNKEGKAHTLPFATPFFLNIDVTKLYATRHL